MGDLSYLAPDAAGYTAAQYWRVTCHGDAGSVETSYNAKSVELTRAGDTKAQTIPVEASHPTGCLDAFLGEIEGLTRADALTTADVIDASRKALLIQQAADNDMTNVTL
jgi:hypothetical protein